MDLELDDDQSTLRDAARSLLAAECPPSLVRAVHEDDDGDRAQGDRLWSTLCASGAGNPLRWVR